ncbi:MAG TPA: [Fe-Fe] hydrogenase large subunit C-terminal domain-containing protein, partial [Spirochaetota bacterium]|nr:[Fe-Fe] hydrogenase large subunit C-terminal domain-containing protein [Spirochaetota bacterium]
EDSRELVKRLGNGERMMGTSCCAAYIEAVHKHNPKFLPFVSDAKTPLAYTSDIARKRYPGTVTVFIGPCIAKKHEVVSGGVADYAITFEELTAILESLEIDVPACNESVPDISVASRKGKLFPVSGNVASAIAESVSNVASISVTVAKIDGFTRKNIGSLTDFVDGAPPANLIEVMSCEGGCVAGSGTIEKPQIAAKKITQS